MRKIFYIIVIAFASSFAITGCTEEEIVPPTTPRAGGGGGGVFDPL